MLTKKLLGDFIPRPPTRAVPLYPVGGLPAILLCPAPIMETDDAYDDTI